MSIPGLSRTETRLEIDASIICAYLGAALRGYWTPGKPHDKWWSETIRASLFLFHSKCPGEFYCPGSLWCDSEWDKIVWPRQHQPLNAGPLATPEAQRCRPLDIMSPATFLSRDISLPEYLGANCSIYCSFYPFSRSEESQIERHFNTRYLVKLLAKHWTYQF